MTAPRLSAEEIDWYVDVLVDIVVRLTRQTVQRALEILDDRELVGVDQAEVLQRLAAWKAECQRVGTWDQVAEAAASATVHRHARLHASGSQ